MWRRSEAPKGKPCDGTAEFSSKIPISLNFTAEHTENAEASKRIATETSEHTEGKYSVLSVYSVAKNILYITVLKLCVLGALRGDKSLHF